MEEIFNFYSDHFGDGDFQGRFEVTLWITEKSFTIEHIERLPNYEKYTLEMFPEDEQKRLLHLADLVWTDFNSRFDWDDARKWQEAERWLDDVQDNG